MENNKEAKIYDAIIIGSGPSGISCAIYLKRFNRNILVIGKDKGALEKTTYIDNYYGINHITGEQLIDLGIKQAQSLEIEVINDEVLQINNGINFTVECKNHIYNAKTIFLGTGKARTKVNIDNAQLFDGKGISYCAICDGFLYRSKKIGIIGSGEYMKKELETLKRFSSDITIFTNGEELILDNYNIVKEKIISFYGEKKLKGIKTINKDYELDAVFIAIGSANTILFAKHIGLIVDEKDNLVVDNFQTNVKGIFSGGDAIGGLLQIVKATSDGAHAAIEMNKYLKNK